MHHILDTPQNQACFEECPIYGASFSTPLHVVNYSHTKAKALRPHTNFGDLVSMHACVMNGVQINVPTETFNIAFQTTQNKQQYGTEITCIEVSLKKIMLS